MADVNYYSIADQNDVVVENKTFPESGIDPEEYSDIVKLSNAKNITIKNCFIKGGQEDCIDMNRYCENVLVEDTNVSSGGLYCFTIKGGTKNVTLKNVVVGIHGHETDIDLGNWSDQSSELTTGVVLDNVKSVDGKPVRVRVLWADKPTVINSNVKVCVVPKWMVAIYRFLRKHNLVP
jgi:hypothetical protein